MRRQQSLFAALRRGYATDSVEARKLRLSFTLPHQILLKDVPVHQVNLKSSDGDIGVLASHVPSLLQLRPGLLEVISEAGSSAADAKKQWFVSGGFVTVNPDSSMQIAAMEAVEVEKLDRQLVAEGLSEAQKKVQATAGAPLTDRARAEAMIHHEVYQAMSQALSK